jgi:hypothetical protein
MHQFALQMVQHEPWSKEMFLKHRKPGRSTSESLRIIANTWLRILWLPCGKNIVTMILLSSFKLKLEMPLKRMCLKK